MKTNNSFKALIIIPDSVSRRSVEYILNINFSCMDTTRIDNFKENFSLAQIAYYDIVLVDETIEHITIDAFISNLLAITPSQKILVLGAESNQNPLQFYQKGCFGYLKYPWNIEQLKFAVSELSKDNIYLEQKQWRSTTSLPYIFQNNV